MHNGYSPCFLMGNLIIGVNTNYNLSHLFEHKSDIIDHSVGEMRKISFDILRKEPRFSFASSADELTPGHFSSDKDTCISSYAS